MGSDLTKMYKILKGFDKVVFLWSSYPKPQSQNKGLDAQGKDDKIFFYLEGSKYFKCSSLWRGVGW